MTSEENTVTTEIHIYELIHLYLCQIHINMVDKFDRPHYDLNLISTYDCIYQSIINKNNCWLFVVYVKNYNFVYIIPTSTLNIDMKLSPHVWLLWNSQLGYGFNSGPPGPCLSETVANDAGMPVVNFGIVTNVRP